MNNDEITVLYTQERNSIYKFLPPSFLQAVPSLPSTSSAHPRESGPSVGLTWTAPPPQIDHPNPNPHPKR